MSDVSDTAVTDPTVPIQRGPPPEDQRDERLPWRRLLKAAAAVLGAFAVTAGAAVFVQYDETGALQDDRTIAGKQVRSEQLGIVEPRLIERETRAKELAALRKQQLKGWSWVDREQNLVRMPIERAMQLVVEKSEGRR
jgi:hypothetical protein